MLGTEQRSSVRAASVFNHLAIYTNVFQNHYRGSIYMGLHCACLGYVRIKTKPRYSQACFSKRQNLPEVIGSVLLPRGSSHLLIVLCLGQRVALQNAYGRKADKQRKAISKHISSQTLMKKWKLSVWDVANDKLTEAIWGSTKSNEKKQKRVKSHGIALWG